MTERDMDCIMSDQLQKVAWVSKENMQIECRDSPWTLVWIIVLWWCKRGCIGHFLIYFLYARVAPEHLLIERLIPVLLTENFSVNWILAVDQNHLDKIRFCQKYLCGDDEGISKSSQRWVVWDYGSWWNKDPTCTTANQTHTKQSLQTSW